MNIKSVVLIFWITVCMISCSKENCSENVIPPQASILVELIDESTEENVFTNETYTQSDITVTELDASEVDYNFITRDGLNLIQIFPKTNNATGNAININVASDDVIKIQYNVETISTECYIQKNVINVVTPDYTTIEANKIYRIKI
jgi:hypothetical protein